MYLTHKTLPQNTAPVHTGVKARKTNSLTSLSFSHSMLITRAGFSILLQEGVKSSLSSRLSLKRTSNSNLNYLLRPVPETESYQNRSESCVLFRTLIIRDALRIIRKCEIWTAKRYKYNNSVL